MLHTYSSFFRNSFHLLFHRYRILHILLFFFTSFYVDQCTVETSSNEEALPRKKWKQHKKISKRSPNNEAFYAARAISLNDSGDVAVVDEIVYEEPQECGGGWVYLRDRPRVYVFAEDGSERFVLNSAGSHENPPGILQCGSDVAVTKQGHFAVTDNTTDVKLFDVKGQNIGTFSIEEGASKTKQEARARCITSNSKCDLYVGDFTEQVITLHDADNFAIKQDIPVSINPSHIAVNSQGHICVVRSPFIERRPQHRTFCKVVVVDDSGDELFTISPTVWGNQAIPLGVVYDADDTLLLAVLDRNIKRGGHVHRYGKKGEFIECLIKGKEEPCGIALRGDSLAIADEKSVLIYKAE